MVGAERQSLLQQLRLGLGRHPNPSTPVASTKHRPWLLGLALDRKGFSVLLPDHTESIPEYSMSPATSPKEKCTWKPMLK